MTDDFTDLELSKPVDEMEAEEAKETLSEFMDSHRENREAYDSVRAEFSERESELEEQIESLEETISEFTQERAEEAADYVNMPADLLAARFSLDEIETIIEDGEEFSEESGDDNDDETQLTTFSNKPEKGKQEGGSETAKFRGRAKEALSTQGFTIEGGN